MAPRQFDELIARLALGSSRGDGLKGIVGGALYALGLPDLASAKNDEVRSSPSMTIDDGDLPLVRCICPTFNRPPDHQHLLEEAIESFLRQDYPHKELIVLIDCPAQQLVCHAPAVRVVNLAARISTLGEKYNAAIALARGTLLAPWEVDDISLPWRLTLSVQRLGDAAYSNPRGHWFMDGDGLHSDHAMGYGHNLSLFTRDACEAVGGYAAISGSQDAAMDAALLRRAADNQAAVAAEEGLARRDWYSIYRWDVSPTHLSGSLSAGDFYREVGRQPVQAGGFVLQPHWRIDYGAAVKAFT